jgi:hypothetical protein
VIRNKKRLKISNFTADLGVDDPMLDSVESLEQLSNASVYHANFEKVKVSF